MMNKRAVGAAYERRAADYLRRGGYTILARNFRGAYGEIDLVARDERAPGHDLVFVEVKYRRDQRAGYPEEALGARKMYAIARTADWYLARYGVPEGTACRFDVIAIEGDRLRHYVNAFEHP